MKRYKTVDKTLPRFRISKYRESVLTKELFDRYKATHKNDVDWKTFKLVNERIAEELKNMAINNRDGVLLPYQLGHLWIGLFKINRHPVAIDIHGKERKIISFDTLNLQGKICWDLDHVQYPNGAMRFYGFSGHRDFKTEAGKAFKERSEYYRRIPVCRTPERIKRQNQIKNEQLNNIVND